MFYYRTNQKLDKHRHIELISLQELKVPMCIPRKGCAVLTFICCTQSQSRVQVADSCETHRIQKNTTQSKGSGSESHPSSCWRPWSSQMWRTHLVSGLFQVFPEDRKFTGLQANAEGRWYLVLSWFFHGASIRVKTSFIAKEVLSFQSYLYLALNCIFFIYLLRISYIHSMWFFIFLCTR